MATTTYFTKDNNLSNLKSWFEANATEYFDSFTLAEDGSSLTLTKSGIDMITLETTGVAGKTVTFKLIDGTKKSITLASASSTILYVNRITKTNCGIAIAFSITGSAGNDIPIIYISKTSSGYTGITFITHVTITGSSANICTFDETSLGSFNLSAADGAKKFGVEQKELTTLCPLVSGGKSTEYLPNVYLTPSSQYVGTQCKFSLDGAEYLYNGYIALKD